MSSLQSQLVDKEAREPGTALQHRYAEKWRKYGEECQREGLVFQPLPLTVLGSVHPAGVRVLKTLSASLARVVGKEEAEISRHLFGRVSVLLMKGNSQLILARAPSHPDPETDGLL